ncbi:MAG: hypothetical protein NWR03_01600 [Akkermansiaceae bacterium]|jgi:hypothetical protein|nr:hypothetical protein [Akkermansiaceae bacterium]MDP4778802.1 hypothetical protein [Akkermansiaceae bacterium]MDP4896454.1 hypothetical protein [Akkermansiaceae bacterium]
MFSSQEFAHELGLRIYAKVPVNSLCVSRDRVFGDAHLFGDEKVGETLLVKTAVEESGVSLGVAGFYAYTQSPCPCICRVKAYITESHHARAMRQ